MNVKLNRCLLIIPVLLSMIIGFINCTVSYAEGLSDSELYGYGSENVLGHKVKETKKRTDTTQIYNYGNKKEDIENKVDDDVKDVQVDDCAENSKESKAKKSNEDRRKVVSEDAKKDVKLLQIVITGVNSDAYYNDELNIDIDVNGTDDSDNVEAIIKKKAFDGVEDCHEIIMDVSSDGAVGKERVVDEGEYMLDVQVLNGVNVKKHVNTRFVVDKTPPIIDEELFSELIVNEIDPENLRHNMVRDNSPVETVVKVNDKEVSDVKISDEGEYDVVIESKDKAGNVSVADYCAIIGNDQHKVDGIKKQSTYHQLIGVVMLIGCLLFYRERKASDKKEEMINEEE